MLLTQAPPILGALLLLQVAAATPKHTWISDLKANRATLGTAEIRVRGDVVDIRSTSPTAKFGFYRLIDASDPAGLLIRTNALPKEGGAFRVRARMATQQSPDGSLILDELDRVRTDRRSMVALALAILSALCLCTLGILAGRAAVEERRYKVAPPLWLLPDAGPYGKALAVPGGTMPPLKYSPELEDQDRRQRERLNQRKRNLVQLTLGSLGLTTLCGVWLLISRPASAQVPAFIFIEANDVPIPAAVLPIPAGDTAQSLLAVQESTAIATPPLRQDSTQRPSVAPALPPRRRDSARGGAQAAPRDTAVAQPVSVPPPPPPPPLPPPPAPTPVPVTDRPPRDSAVERSRATEALGEAANALISAMNGRRMTEIALMLPETLAGDLGRRERFIKLIKDSAPRATFGTLEEAALTEGGAEATFAVNFSWRGDFGVDRRKTGRFLGKVTREETGWRFAGARLLDAVP